MTVINCNDNLLEKPSSIVFRQTLLTLHKREQVPSWSIFHHQDEVMLGQEDFPE
jgi:hypothetical protein